MREKQHHDRNDNDSTLPARSPTRELIRRLATEIVRRLREEQHGESSHEHTQA
ncbi:hypothetical protein Pan216_32750 [Planctomycetes bacterium Pan216]|uniref:Uncharacterized protein n=1 Tax=Kolteria novifilia TaxID=2527975 RepID=A0A518B608_9BACT|nr:hypothetical protein Pan216_32750 [Planctomycetes bacterium Pan216]